MALSRAQQREIMIRDEERRVQRTISEYLALHSEMMPAPAKKGRPDPYHVSRGITGEPSEKNRTYRATDSSWNRGLRASRSWGVVQDEEGNPLTQYTSVRVIRNGTETIVPASNFRPARKTRTRRVVKVAQAPETSRLTHGHNFAD